MSSTACSKIATTWDRRVHGKQMIQQGERNTLIIGCLRYGDRCYGMSVEIDPVGIGGSSISYVIWSMVLHRASNSLRLSSPPNPPPFMAFTRVFNFGPTFGTYEMEQRYVLATPSMKLWLLSTCIGKDVF